MTQIDEERAIERIAGYMTNPYNTTSLQFEMSKNELVKNLEQDIKHVKAVSFDSFKFIYKPTGQKSPL